EATMDLKNPSSEEILAALGTSTKMSFSMSDRLLRDQPDYGRIGPTRLSAWSTMIMLAETQEIPVRWEKTPDGYHLASALPFGNRLTPWLISAAVGLVLTFNELRFVRSRSAQTQP